MYIDKDKISKHEIKRISVTINIFLIILFIVLFFAFWNIQILKNDYYKFLAIKNIHKNIEVKAPRGLILDRNNKILAENKINFSLFLIRENIKNKTDSIRFASTITKLDKKEIIKRINKYKNFPKFYMIPIKKNFPLDKVIYIESRSEELPEFKIEIEPSRAYPHKKNTSHVLGYTSEITTDELIKKKNKGYKLGDEIGRSGIEKEYEDFLKGTKGIKNVIKDNQGKIQEILNEKKPLIGNTIVLTIDIDLQKFVKKTLKNFNGTIGIVDLSTGEILALVSKPSFNPELFSGSFTKKEWLSLINDPDKPLHNKFMQGLYSPGSVFKIVISLAGLQEKILDTSTRVLCTGKEKIYDRFFNCWKKQGHGTMDIYNALKNSCNIFFYQLGKKLDIDVIAKYANLLNLGEKTLIDLPNENKGLIPTRAWKLNNSNQKWYPGETISISIGHGMLNVTPAQILLLISTVALRGEMPQLHLIKRIEKKGKVLMEFKPKFKQIPIDKKNFEIVIKGLFKVVNEGGTASSSKIDGLEICGKTGTSQIISKDNPNYKELVKQKKFKPHSWFASFAPRTNPKIAMVVFIENGGDAGVSAAPIAAKIYRKIFNK